VLVACLLSLVTTKLILLFRIVTSWLKLDSAVIKYTTHENNSGRMANVIFSISAPFAFSSAINHLNKNADAPDDEPNNKGRSDEANGPVFHGYF
jgi:hypothetical protein